MRYSWKIIGHDRQRQILENDLKSGNISHAYLLSGPAQIGKATVAKRMAKILQCAYDLCNKCTSCRLIEQGNHLDTLFSLLYNSILNHTSSFYGIQIYYNQLV